MPDEDKIEVDEGKVEGLTGMQAPANSTEEIDALVRSQVDSQLKDIKSKLDLAYSSRDDAIKKAVAFEEEKKAVEIAQLEQEGKHSEASKLKVTELEAKLEARDKQVTQLTRDNAVRDALKGLDFLNSTAAEFAYKYVVENLVQGDEGGWVHRTGVSINDFIKTFEDDEERKFLFKPKASSGAGQIGDQGKPTGFDPSKKLSEMTTNELMAAAAAGKLDGKKKWL